MSQRFEELESRLAFQDYTIDQLSTVTARQDQEIRLLQQQVSELMARLDDLGSSELPEGEASQHEIPPHY
jgi:SlyX protein